MRGCPLRKLYRSPGRSRRGYKTMYAYDHTPLNAKSETLEQESTNWRKEKITFDAAYGKERMVGYLFLPSKVRPLGRT